MIYSPNRVVEDAQDPPFCQTCQYSNRLQVLWLSPNAREGAPLQDCTNQLRHAPTGTDS